MHWKSYLLFWKLKIVLSFCPEGVHFKISKKCQIFSPLLVTVPCSPPVLSTSTLYTSIENVTIGMVYKYCLPAMMYLLFMPRLRLGHVGRHMGVTTGIQTMIFSTFFKIFPFFGNCLKSSPFKVSPKVFLKIAQTPFLKIFP